MMPLRIENMPRGAAIKVTVNGRPVKAYQGETVYGALLAAGFLTLIKSTRLNAPRGSFCGMGVCCECLVAINGEPNQRACMRLVAPGMEIRIDADNL
jgi:predicted molibdopterin-dependent oxidoreductase YjgC